jgi:hypothetical protein
MAGYDPCRVAPFGDPRIKAWLAAPRGLSQLPHVLRRLLMPRHPPDTLSSLGNIRLLATRATRHPRRSLCMDIAVALPRILGSITRSTCRRPARTERRRHSVKIDAHCQRAVPRTGLRPVRERLHATSARSRSPRHPSLARGARRSNGRARARHRVWFGPSARERAKHSILAASFHRPRPASPARSLRCSP